MASLIQRVVPSVGNFCASSIKNGKIIQKFFTTREDVEAYGLAASAQGRNAYYAMASFKDDQSRTQDNVDLLKAFWLDVDCKDKDPAKDYANKQDGLEAIQTFCKAFSFPRPTIVDSGNGWHVYWILSEAVSRDDWQYVANALKSTCLMSGLRIDPACTADSARILRIPDTLNFRSDPPAIVALVLESPDVEFDAFADLVTDAMNSLGKPQKVVEVKGSPTQKEMSAVTKALIHNTTSSFKKILIRSINGTGCQQILDGVNDQANTEEPMWRGLLSVAQCCTDRDIAIHAISKEHPDYDPQTTEEKAEQTKGPYTCATFDGLRSGICSGCKHWGAITSPIQLGKEVAATATPITVQVSTPVPPIVPDTNSNPHTHIDHALLDQQLAAFVNSKKQLTIPVPPQPYMRGQNGGIYKRMRLEDGTFDDVLIYENDFYAYARLFDVTEGQVLVCRLHLPMDAVRNFTIPLKDIVAKERFRETVSKQGVAASDKMIGELMHYMITAAKELQHMQKEEKARTHMGWQEDHTFVLGDREYSPAGIRNCPASSATINYQHLFGISGDLPKWRKIVDTYNAPGFEIHQFCVLLGMASPMFDIYNAPAAMIGLISDESGIGKTTLQHVCNSVWGHPLEMMSMPKDTEAAIIHRMGIFNSIMLNIDEFTNKSAEACSNLLYGADNGKGPARMQGSINAERVNETRWTCPVMVSANSSPSDKVASAKASSEGENMRLIEFDMRGTPVLDKLVADTIFAPLLENYGVAGHILASYYVRNRKTIAAQLKTVGKEVDTRFKFTSKERKWSRVFTAVFTMGFIGKELGLHDFNVTKLMDHMVDMLEQMRHSVQESVTQFDSLLSEFLIDHHNFILVVDGLPDKNGLMPIARNKNINRIIARYEPDTGKLFVVQKDIRKYCAERQFSFNSLIKLTGGVQTKQRLSTGTGVVGGPVHVVRFDTNAVGLDMSMWKEQDADQAAE